MTRSPFTALESHARPLHPITLHVKCSRLGQRLYRCSFFAHTVGTDSHDYYVRGRSMVRFDKRVHVRLYNLSCTRYNITVPTKFGSGC